MRLVIDHCQLVCGSWCSKATIQAAHDYLHGTFTLYRSWNIIQTLQLLPLYSLGSVCSQPSRWIGSATHQSGFVAQPCALEAASADPFTEMYLRSLRSDAGNIPDA